MHRFRILAVLLEVLEIFVELLRNFGDARLVGVADFPAELVARPQPVQLSHRFHVVGKKFAVNLKIQIISVDTQAGNPNWRERLSTVDLLALTSLDQLVFISKVLITFVTKTSHSIRSSTV